MKASRLSLIVKAHPAAIRGSLQIDGRDTALKLERLLPDIQPSGRQRLSAAADPVWHLASLDREAASPWDACHALLEQGLGVSGRSGVTFAEPDLEQQWLWAPESRQAFGMVPECGNPEAQDSDVYAVGPEDGWFSGSRFSQLDDARSMVKVPNDGARIRIAHLDTGYDPTHCSTPEHVNNALERDFLSIPPGNRACDLNKSGILKNPGHGVATLALLAGRDEAGKPLGGAALLEVVPIRVAEGVVLFKNSTIAKALNYIYSLSSDPGTRIDVVTMSMGGLASAAWADAVNALYDQGIFMVSAAGNNFGNLPTRYIVYPARFRRVVAACGIMADGRPYADLPLRKMAGCYGPRRKEATAIAAYTPNLPWARIGCSELFDQDGGGTSSATPQIASAAALWLQNHRERIDQEYGGDKAWARVEAVRKALFESAERPANEALKRRFGRGVLRAENALAVEPAKVADLKIQKRDEVSFPLIRVLTGLGVTDQISDGQRMLEIEALQISQRSRSVEEALAEIDPNDIEAGDLDRIHRRRVLEAIADEGQTSQTLRNVIARHLRQEDGGNPIPQSRSDRTTGRPPPLSSDDFGSVGELNGGSIQTYVAEAPPERHLRVYAFDPLLGTRLETLNLNEATIAIPWERNLKPGPVGEYFEVVDIDPSSGNAYLPVDLNQPEILAQSGLKPAEGVPQFHQQMVYGVAMKTITHFEQALGRVSLWAEREAIEDDAFRFRFVQRLRIYPHALREANAYYDPAKWALLFGYFNASEFNAGDNLPGGLIFTCLSHDIIVHETCHALLDGIHPYFREPTNRDMLAFHEAFADIVALFQHFTMPEAVRDQIAKSRGDLRIAELLGGLAGQFGQAIGHHGALRSAISKHNPETDKWDRIEPSRHDYEAHSEPHLHGAVLVAAVFDAFLQIFEYRTRDLIRLATSGLGVLPEGAISHDLAERLSQEASKTAETVLSICIRALDYCPPVDLTFGEYLRAVVTADRDLVPDDDKSFRVAFVSAFRARGIFPPGVSNLSVDALVWQSPEVFLGESGASFEAMIPEWKLDSDRLSAYTSANHAAENVYKMLHEKRLPGLEHWTDEHSLNLLGVILTDKEKTRVIDGVKGKISKTRILSMRPLRRLGPKGRVLNDIVIEITQRWTPAGDKGFYRGGCTIIYDADTHAVKYIIRKRLGSKVRTNRQRGFAFDLAMGPYSNDAQIREQPFALLHRGH